MVEKKRPLLTVFLILLIIGLVLGLSSLLIIKKLGNTTKLTFGDKIGVIPIEGPISNAQPIISQLVHFKKDRNIKAIILRINSPGGGVGPSQEIYREVIKIRKDKRVVASMGAVAASGGYYIAAAANKIVANPGTITGSIGVIMEFVRMEELLKKIGISFEVLKSGEFKDMGSPHRKLTEKEKKLLRDLIMDIQGQFVKAVAEGRNMPIEKVRSIADGRILSGAQAKRLGLVDKLGNFRDAVEVAKELAHIKGEPSLVYPSKQKPGLWDVLFENAAKAILNSVKGTKTLFKYQWPGEMDSSLTETY